MTDRRCPKCDGPVVVRESYRPMTVAEEHIFPHLVGRFVADADCRACSVFGLAISTAAERRGLSFKLFLVMVCITSLVCGQMTGFEWTFIALQNAITIGVVLGMRGWVR